MMEEEEGEDKEEETWGATHGRPPWTESGSHSGQWEGRDSGLMCVVGNEVEKCIAEVGIRNMQRRMVENDNVFVLFGRISSL